MWNQSTWGRSDRAESEEPVSGERCPGEQFNERGKHMKLGKRRMINAFLLTAGALYVGSAASAGAQVVTKTTTKTGQSSEVVRVDRGEVLAVEGNDLIVKMEDGSIRHFENIPESAKVTVSGKQ